MRKEALGLSSSTVLTGAFSAETFVTETRVSCVRHVGLGARVLCGQPLRSASPCGENVAANPVFEYSVEPNLRLSVIVGLLTRYCKLQCRGGGGVELDMSCLMSKERQVCPDQAQTRCFELERANWRQNTNRQFT